jgi:hypothetical protein
MILVVVIGIGFVFRLSDHQSVLRDSRPKQESTVLFKDIRHITNMNRESKINITYLRDPVVDLCYALILGILPDNGFLYSVEGIVPVSCKNIPDDLFVGNIGEGN